MTAYTASVVLHDSKEVSVSAEPESSSPSPWERWFFPSRRINNEKRKGSFSEVKSTTNSEVRKGLCAFHQKNGPLQWVHDRLHKAAQEAEFGWELNPLEFIQITEYNVEKQGGHYKRHRDIIIEQKPQRIISSVTQLSTSDSYRGSQLVFDKNSGLPSSEEIQGVGDTIFFKADEPHEVSPVQSGIRFSLVAWFTGPELWTRETLPYYF